MQPVRKWLTARRATTGLAVANSRERKGYRILLSLLTYIHVGNNAGDHFLTGPKGDN